MESDSDSEERKPRRERHEFEFMTVRSVRLKMFSDAVWSIIATIMIVPIMNMKIAEEVKKGDSHVREIVEKLIPHVLIYILAFLIVCTTWAAHVWAFQTVKKVTDLNIIINLIALLAASFLPYFYSVMSRFKTSTSVIIYSSIQIFIGIVQCIQVHLSFRRTKLLTAKIYEKTEKEKNTIKWRIVSRLLVAPAFCSLAIIFSFFSVPTALVTLIFILIFPWIQSFFRFILTQIPACARFQREVMLNRDLFLTERIKKHRIEAFSDGVFAITSTLLVLYITEKHVPETSVVRRIYGGDLSNALRQHWGIYVAYILAFMVIGLLWFTQLTLFKNLIKISRMMQFINNLSLASVGLIPLAFMFVLNYKVIDSVIVGVQFGCIAIILVEFFFFLIYLTALLLDRKNRHPDKAWLCTRVQPGGTDFGIMLFMLIGLPIGCIVVFCLTYLKNRTAVIYVFMGVIILYALLVLLGKTIVAYLYPVANYPAHGRDDYAGEEEDAEASSGSRLLPEEDISDSH